MAERWAGRSRAPRGGRPQQAVLFLFLRRPAAEPERRFPSRSPPLAPARSAGGLNEIGEQRPGSHGGVLLRRPICIFRAIPRTGFAGDHRPHHAHQQRSRSIISRTPSLHTSPLGYLFSAIHGHGQPLRIPSVPLDYTMGSRQYAQRHHTPRRTVPRHDSLFGASGATTMSNYGLDKPTHLIDAARPTSTAQARRHPGARGDCGEHAPQHEAGQMMSAERRANTRGRTRRPP